MRTPQSPARPARFRHSTLVAALSLAMAPLGGLAAVQTYTVTSAADSGVGTLRDILDTINKDLNCSIDSYAVNFGGPFVIQPSTPLPVINCPNVTVNANEAAGVVIDGSVVYGGTCALQSSISRLAVVKRVAIRNFPGQAAICGTVHALNNTIENVNQGMDLAAGSLAYGNTITAVSGISIYGAGNITFNTLTTTGFEGIYGEDDGYGGPSIDDNVVNAATGFFGIVAYRATSVSRNTVTGAEIGISVNGSGLQVIGNTLIDNVYGGIVANNGAVVEGNRVGGSPTGIFADGVTLRGNFVGTFGGLNPNQVGIMDQSSLTGATIVDNFVSGNTTAGILIDSFSGAVNGNKVGTNAAGNAAVPNDGVGIFVTRSTFDYTIAGNTVSGNNGTGIFVEADGLDLRINGNLVGVSSDGRTAVPNGFGVDVPCGGFQVSLKGNTVSGNRSHGIWLGGVTGEASYGSLENNKIGTSQDGLSAIGNNGNGVTLAAIPSVEACAPILVGGKGTKRAGDAARQARLAALKLERKALATLTAKALRAKAINMSATNDVPILGNTIMNNAGSGIEVRDDGQANHWFGNAIAGNGVKNIDLNGGAALANDTGDTDTGNNLKQNHAVIGTVIQTVAGTTSVTFTLETESPDLATCAVLTSGYNYRVDFFENPAASLPAGRTPIGSGFGGDVTITGPACGGPYTYTHTIAGQRDFLSLTVRNETTKNSSEFSPVVAAVPAPAVTFTPALPVDLGPVPMFGSASRTVTLTSVGGQPWRFTSFGADAACGRLAGKAVVTACSAPFSCDTTCVAGTDVPNGGSCTLSATYSPTAVGSATQTIYLCDNAHASGHPVTLTGEGLPAAVATLSPATWNFDFVRLGQKSAFKRFSVLNENPVATAIASITTSSPDFVIESTSCPVPNGTLPPGVPCEVILSFAPSIPGPTSGTLRVASGGGGLSDATAALQGQGTQVAEISLPASLDFGTYTLGSAAITRAVTITNTGNTEVNFSSVTASAPFTLNNGCGTTLAPNASCTFVVSFAPGAVGTFSGALVVSSNAQGSGSVALSGTAQAAPVPLATLSSGLIDLGGVPVGTTSAAGAITLTSTGTAPYVIAKYSTDASCAVAASVCSSGEFLCSLGCNPGESYAPGSSCTISARFAPQALGLRSASFFICDNTTASPRAVTIKGEGTNPVVIGIAPASHDFGVVPVGQSSAARTFTVVNSSGATVTITAPFTSANYRVATHNCPATLGPSQRCAVDVQFAPTLAGAVAGQLVIQTSGAGQSTAFATLRGTGGTQPVLELPTAVDFGSVQLGTGTVSRTVTVTNAGNSPLTLSSVTVSGTFYSLQNDCTASVAPGASCNLRVTFAPTESGEFNGALTVVANVSGGPRAVSLTGRAQPRPLPLVRVSPANMGFGDRQIGSQGEPQRVTVSNVGGAAAAIERISLGPDYVIAANTCSGAIAAQQSCVIDVALRPVGFGPRTSQLLVFTNSEGSPHTVNLGGTGCRPFTPGSRNSGRNAACAP